MVVPGRQHRRSCTDLAIGERLARERTEDLVARPTGHSVAVRVGLVWSADRYAEVASLLSRQLGEPNPERIEMQPRNSLVEMLRQHVHPDCVIRGLRVQLALGHDLARERA